LETGCTDRWIIEKERKRNRPNKSPENPVVSQSDCFEEDNTHQSTNIWQIYLRYLVFCLKITILNMYRKK
jgi:hypothetical protein